MASDVCRRRHDRRFAIVDKTMKKFNLAAARAGTNEQNWNFHPPELEAARQRAHPGQTGRRRMVPSRAPQFHRWP
jgi:hypothetical protein